eukprot:TRINITY_DN6179_c0_g1_i3.p1 TRINITY_DN6179_c0_g1~~TRINITY_DN6179_c0_g1_i3.p1  ORF type:complete len:181 (-),score=26.37 TRINITY_DN6179_c0_g1_i3:45-587(-)
MESTPSLEVEESQKQNPFDLLPKEIFSYLFSFIKDMESADTVLFVCKAWKKEIEKKCPWKDISLQLWIERGRNTEELILAQQNLRVRWRYFAITLLGGDQSERLRIDGSTILCGDAVKTGSGLGRKYWTSLKCLFEGEFSTFRTFGYGCYTYSPGQTYKGNLLYDSAEGRGVMELSLIHI